MSGEATAPVRVAVLVDLMRGPRAGGHVKIWERLAHEAIAVGDHLDLTVYFSGERDHEVALAPHVRLVEQRPVFSTARLPFLSHVPAHTDLAPFHFRLARRLARHHVLHTTDAFFAFARTAARVARRTGRALCNSVHTNTPLYTRLFTAATLEKITARVGLAGLSAPILRALQLPARAEAQMSRQLDQHQRRCAFAFVSRPDQAVTLAERLSPGRVGLLRRGIDHQRFHPGQRDRRALGQLLGLPLDRPWLLFAGRLDRSKNVLTAVRAVQALEGAGCPVHLLCAGDGADRAEVARQLGSLGSCVGTLPTDQLARAYASADLFVQPSVTEECSNVILEALTSGLPVVVPQQGGSGRLFPNGDAGLVVDGAEDVAAWVGALRSLIDDPPRRARMGQAARAFAERSIPTWRAVLTEDLLPVWRRLASPPSGTS